MKETTAITLVLGPTAVGKSEFTLKMAHDLGGEIISADAFQVYKGLDIGTAKISKESRQEVPHHLIDIKLPSESYSVADFLTSANTITEDLQKKRIPSYICGGTGFYLFAFLHRFELSQAQSDPAIREALMLELDQVGSQVLWERLKLIDPSYAEKVSCNDAKRIVRGLEIYAQTDEVPSHFQKKSEPRKDVRVIGLTAPKEVLHERINSRVDRMIEAGLIEEVRYLIAGGADPHCQAFEALGYKEVVQFLNRSLSQKEMVELIKLRTRQFAKRQMTWFKRFNHVEWIST